MKIKKTVGVSNPDNFNDRGYARKDYVIHTTCGHQAYAKASGSQGYECGGVFYPSLKALKTHIVDSGSLDEESKADDNKSPMWDCIDPCALLIHNMMEYNLVLGHNEMTTLDNFGWLTEDGKVDSERAKKEYARISS